MSEQSVKKDYLFNFSFTRADEQHSDFYTVGFHIHAATRELAEESLRRQHAHLTIIDVELFAVMDEDGNTIDEDGNIIEIKDCPGDDRLN